MKRQKEGILFSISQKSGGDSLKRLDWKKIRKIALACFSIYVAFSLVQQEFAIKELEKSRVEKQEQLKHLEAESKEIEEKIENKEDIQYIEEIARDELNMVRPNEIIYEDANASSADNRPDKE